MLQPQEMYCSNRIPTDTDVLAGLRQYNLYHNGQQVQNELAKIWPLKFAITSVETLNLILPFFSDEQREEYIDSIREDLPVCSSRDWRDFLSYCSDIQCQHFLQKLSPISCSDLYGKRGFFVKLVVDANKFSLKNLEQILNHIFLHFPMIISSDFELHMLRFMGVSTSTEKMSLILKYIQPHLSRLTLSVDELVKCLSINTGMAYYHKAQWTAIIKTYFIVLAPKLPYIFYSPEQIQKFYQKLGNDRGGNRYNAHNQTSTYTCFSPELVQYEFEEPIQKCLTHLPNVYQFVSKYQPSADSFIELLVQYGIEMPLILDSDTYPIQLKFDQFIHQVITSNPQTWYGYVYAVESPEDRLVDDLSNLSPYWLEILNTHIDSLNWNPTLNAQETHALFSAYINSVKLSNVANTAQPTQNHVFFLKTLAALALSAALLGIGLLMVFSALPTSLGVAVTLSGAVLGFFAYTCRNEQESTAGRPRVTIS